MSAIGTWQAALVVALVVAGGAGGSTLVRAQDAAPIAVLPFEVLGDAAAPVAAIREALLGSLAARRIALLDEEVLETFMRHHRVRYIGGLALDTGQAIRAETGAGAVLVTSVDLYAEKDPPRLALTSRLISTGDRARILWMDSARMAGNEAPGFLGLGRIDDPGVLREKVIERLADSLARHLLRGEGQAADAPARARVPRRFRPRISSRSPGIQAAKKAPVRIAVLPFSDDSTTRHAGDVLFLQVLKSLVDAGSAEILEPGVVREVLLKARLVQEQGPSIPQADLLRALLEVDVVLFGEVIEYIEAGAGAAEPEIEFSIRAIDTARRQAIWSSVSHGRGDDGVFFFERGRVPTAHELASEMARGLIERFLSSAEKTS
ncbi:MAG: hypothetical protein AAB249_09745 [Acidobacteriota bacterium]